MNTIELSQERFLRFPSLKHGVVHIHNGNLYKYSPSSWGIVTTIEKYHHEEVFNHLSIPKAYFFNQKEYLGYVMEYYKKLKRIKEALKKGLIKDLNEYLFNLIVIVEKLNELNLIYWDFHDDNILVDEKGNPFIIDIDDIEIIPAVDEFYRQRRYLTEFILNMYFEDYRSFGVYLRNKELRNILSKKIITYMENLTTHAKPIPDLPYLLIEELKDDEKLQLIKRSIK